MRPPRFTPRSDYRQEEARRTAASVSLSDKYRDLKSLTVQFEYFSPDGVPRNSQIKYTVNPDHAKSVFRLDCFNTECIRGDFDLSDVLARAVAERQTTVAGELRCQGWLSKTTIDRIHCHEILRYKLSLEYATQAAIGVAGAVTALSIAETASSATRKQQLDPA